MLVTWGFKCVVFQKVNWCTKWMLSLLSTTVSLLYMQCCYSYIMSHRRIRMTSGLELLGLVRRWQYCCTVLLFDAHVWTWGFECVAFQKDQLRVIFRRINGFNWHWKKLLMFLKEGIRTQCVPWFSWASIWISDSPPSPCNRLSDPSNGNRRY